MFPNRNGRARILTSIHKLSSSPFNRHNRLHHFGLPNLPTLNSPSELQSQSNRSTYSRHRQRSKCMSNSVRQQQILGLREFRNLLQKMEEERSRIFTSSHKLSTTLSTMYQFKCLGACTVNEYRQIALRNYEDVELE